MLTDLVRKEAQSEIACLTEIVYNAIGTYYGLCHFFTNKKVLVRVGYIHIARHIIKNNKCNYTREEIHKKSLNLVCNRLRALYKELSELETYFTECDEIFALLGVSCEKVNEALQSPDLTLVKKHKKTIDIINIEPIARGAIVMC